MFSSPLEDTSGLDVFAQIAASVKPLPVETAHRATLTTAEMVQQNQSQLAKRIYMAQQALRQQQHNPDEPTGNRETRAVSVANTGTANMSFDPLAPSESKDRSASANEHGDGEIVFPRPAVEQKTLIGNDEKSLPLTPLDMNKKRRQVHKQPENAKPRRTTRSSVEASPYNVSSALGLIFNRRIVHNSCERKRRDNIRDGFARLHARLPQSDESGNRLSKMSILQGTVDLIGDLKRRTDSLATEVGALVFIYEHAVKPDQSKEHDKKNDVCASSNSSRSSLERDYNHTQSFNTSQMNSDEDVDRDQSV